MPTRAKLTSLEALESFRASLIVYLEKATRVLDEINDEVLRTKLWVQIDQREYWRREMRRRARELEQRQQELFSAKLSTLREATHVEHMAVRKARRALDDATAKLNSVKKWNRHYPNRVETLAQEVDKLRDFLTVYMGKAVLYLGQVTKTLSDYAELSPPDTVSARIGHAEPVPADAAVPTRTGRETA